MGTNILIHHPQRHDVLPPGFLVASGEAFTGSQLAGILLGRRHLIPGRTLLSGEFWAVAFDRVPRGRYELVVFDTQQAVPPARRRFRVRPPGHFDVFPRWPGDGMTINNGFTAYGTVSTGVTSVSGTLVGSDSVPIAGNVLQQPVANSGWAVEFTAPKPFHQKYNMTITGSDQSKGTANNLTLMG